MAEQKNYALTIAIPTYNRLEKLKICLKRLMEQKKIEQIEIIVSDNDSTDGTGEYMTELVKKAENIHYYRNTENVGPDKNFLNCFDKAVGEYVLLLGDDDFLLPMACLLYTSDSIVSCNGTILSDLCDSEMQIPADQCNWNGSGNFCCI